MPASTVRSDYDQLNSVAQSFSAQADAINNMNSNLQSCVDTLNQGDWIGQGAQAFYREMGDQIMPTLKRLKNAMDESARITKQISQAMQEAEQGASGFLHI
jgi:WXG100 family type VII secretion target